jgi:Uma2 family endonuclease
MSAAAQRLPPLPATLADLLALPDEGHGYEIIDGELVEKETSAEHSKTQASVVGRLMHRYQRQQGGRWPGGWWFGTEPLIAFPGVANPLRPDVVGWRREKAPTYPTGKVISVVPDWICEILSTNFTNDTIKKKRYYHQARVGHYWLIEPVQETLQVYRWDPVGYTEILSVERDAVVRAEPFEATEIPVGIFFGDEDED